MRKKNQKKKKEEKKKEEKEKPDEHKSNDAMKEEKIPKFSRNDSVSLRQDPSRPELRNRRNDRRAGQRPRLCLSWRLSEA